MEPQPEQRGAKVRVVEPAGSGWADWCVSEQPIASSPAVMPAQAGTHASRIDRNAGGEAPRLQQAMK